MKVDSEILQFSDSLGSDLELNFDSLSTANAHSETSVSNTPISKTLSIDIADYASKQITRDEKIHILNNHFKPDRYFVWPYYQKATEKRYAKPQDLKIYKWMVMSPSKKGYFCLPCCLFIAPKCTRGLHGQLNYKNKKVGALISTELTNFNTMHGPKGNNF